MRRHRKRGCGRGKYPKLPKYYNMKRDTDFFKKYAGVLDRKHKIKSMTAEEFDDLVEKAMLVEIARSPKWRKRLNTRA